MTKEKALILGNLTIDHNLTERGKTISPGGSAFFCARTLRNLNFPTAVVSPFGKDFDKSVLENISLYPQSPTSLETLIFRNVLLSDKKREQFVQNLPSAGFDSIYGIPDSLFSEKKIVMVAPILNNLTYRQISKWKEISGNAYFVLLAQGFFRKVLSSGRVAKRKWIGEGKMVQMFDLIVVSEEDYEDIDEIAARWGRDGRISIVTRAEKGSTIYSEGKVKDTAAFKVYKSVDSTGAGDVFAAAYAFMYVRTRDEVYSAVFANAAAAMSLRFSAKELQYRYEDVIKFMKGR
ncbi:PfkB family carbohydrate kinase [Patescibacteria group bacterium]|nr:PfkB family carbohydrate kinase [Patescibacteria group bacterium]MCL5797735.1 PfkB family carbohydrate kinase [Patescibacteria group bacterium]